MPSSPISPLSPSKVPLRGRPRSREPHELAASRRGYAASLPSPNTRRVFVTSYSESTTRGCMEKGAQAEAATHLTRRRAVMATAVMALWLAPNGLNRYPAAARGAVAVGDAEGMSLEAALAITLRCKAQLKEVTAALSQDPGRDPLAVPDALIALAEELTVALPIVGAEAAYNQKDWRLRLRGTPLDSMVSGFALLDRAADGASEEGPNRNISIKDIERLEEMEALTTTALDAVNALARDARAHADGTSDQKLLARARSLVLTADSALDGILAELPARELATAVSKAV